MIWFLFLYLIAFPFGQLASFQLFSSARIHITDLLAAVLVIAWLADLLWQKRVYKAPHARPLLSFLAVAAFTLILGGIYKDFGNLVIGVMYLLRLALYTAFFLAVFDIVVKEKRKDIRETLHKSLIIVGTFISIIGLIGYFLYPDTRALSEYGWDNHYYRLIGPFLDPAFTGIIIVLSLLAILLKKWDSLGKLALGIVVFATNWLALALTYSRASFVAAITGAFALFFFRRNPIFIPAAIMLFVGTYYFLPKEQSAGTNLKRTQTISSRIQNYQEAWRLGLANPLFGVGYNLYKEAPQDKTLQKITHLGSGVHSSLLFTFATTGVLGLLTFLGFWKKTLEIGLKNKNQYGILLFCSAVALLAHSLFDNSLFYPWVLGWLAILLALQ